MKTITFLAMCTFIMNASFATVRTVSNDPAGGAQYSNLLAAYNAAVANDTLLIEGTNVSYSTNNGCNCCSPSWGKSLIVIGAGINTQKNSPGFRGTYFSATSLCNGSDQGFFIDANGSGSKFYGIIFNTTNILFFNGSVTNITFENCYFPVVFSFNNNSATSINFRNCIFDQNNVENLRLSSNGSNNTGIQIYNCIFDGFINGQNNSIGASVSVDHCLFLTNSTVPIQNFQSQVLRNNIFMNNATVESGGAGNSFKNNICRLGTLPLIDGNKSLTDPLFTTYTFNTQWSNTHDYHLQVGSPAIGASIDVPVSDIGIHGGFTNFNERGEPLNAPVMRTLIINNNVIAPNGTMNVQINASKPSDR